MEAACELQTSVVNQEKQEIIEEKQNKTRNLFFCLSSRCRTVSTMKPNKPRELDIVSVMNVFSSWWTIVTFPITIP